MFAFPRKTKYPSKDQVAIWNLKRKKLSGKEIAKKRDISPAAVSKSLKITTQLIEDLLINTAKSNRIKLEFVDPVLGFAKGYQYTFQTRADLTFSPENGVQVWFSHEGNCSSCEIFEECRKILLTEFKERNIPIKNKTLAPTELCDELILKLEVLSENKKMMNDDKK